MTPDARLAYVLNNGSGTLSIIDLATRRVVSTIATGSDPRGLALSPDGHLIYTIRTGTAGTTSMIAVDTTSHRTVTAVSVDPQAADLVLGPDGRHAYVVDSRGHGTLSIIDLAAGRVTRAVEVGLQPTDIAISPNGHTLYIPARAGTLTIVNIQGAITTNIIELAHTPHTVTAADNDIAYVLGDNRTPDPFRDGPDPPTATTLSEITSSTTVASTAVTDATTVAVTENGRRVNVVENTGVLILDAT